MTVYTRVFGGTTIAASELSYAAYTVTPATSPFVLQWPLESSTSQLVAKILDISPSAANCYVQMPDATLASTGETVLFNNRGAYAFTVTDSTGYNILSVAPGTAWTLYLNDNTTHAGAWESFQQGASTSNANAASLAGAGLTALGSTLGQSMPVSSISSNYTFGAADRAKSFVYTGAVGTFTFPVGAVVGNNWFIAVRNSGSGNLSLTPTTPSQINGTTSVNMAPGDSAIIITDGTNYYTIGLGSKATFQFDYTSIDVSGTGDRVLAGTELNRISYRLTGTLTGNRNIIVPTTVQQYWIDNETTGAYTLTVKTAAGAGYTIPQGARAILYSNGTDVVLADSAALPIPIGVAYGGTGATSASGALVNLGGTSVGINVFQASTAASARATLGSGAVGDNLFTAPDAPTARATLGSGTIGDALFQTTTQAAARSTIDTLSSGDSVALAVALG